MFSHNGANGTELRTTRMFHQIRQTVPPGAKSLYKIAGFYLAASSNGQNKMQSETADFAPGAAIWQTRPNNAVRRSTGAATWQTRRNLRVIFDSGPFPPLCENMASSTNRNDITHCIAVRGGPSNVTCNTQRKFGEIWTCGFLYMGADRKTDRQTDIHADRNTSPAYGGRSKILI